MNNNERVIRTEIIYEYEVKEVFENGCYRKIIYCDKEHTKIDCIQYFNSKNQYHRDNDLPSYISYWNNGNLRCKIWEQNNKRHRLTGSTFIRYDKNGKIELKFYYINGDELSKEEWQKENNLYKNLKLFS